MKTFDDIYRDLVNAIIENGVDQDPNHVRAKYADGSPAPTRAIEGVNFAITPEMGVPRLRSKFVGAKWACTEMEWIYQEMSNNVHWLHEHGGVTIWDSWSKPPVYYIDGREVEWVAIRNVGHNFGEPKTNYELETNDEESRALKKHWETMINRVYGNDERKNHFYRDKGVEVHPEWWDVNNFVRDAKELDNYSFKKNNWDNFVLDKDYYGAKVYSKESCIWLSQEENMLYTDATYAIKVTDNRGLERVFLGIPALVKEYGISKSTAHRFVQKGTVLTGLKRENKRFNSWKFERVSNPEGKLPRLSLLDGTIGSAYGYQVKTKTVPVAITQETANPQDLAYMQRHKLSTLHKNLDQMSYALYQLRTEPWSRSIMINLWSPSELPKMALRPCVWSTHFSVIGGKLNLHVNQRSCDVALTLAPLA